ncbi:MAG TPA: efflux RND transporter periplasmic adaptor subunit [Bacteroidetes bacterium]|nr:efflux RND transporter periplasmic adaptor subunit [Bacteroidota bacterium]
MNPMNKGETMRKILAIALTALLLAGCGKKGKKQVFTGVLEGKSLHVPAMVGGKIESLYVEIGDEVQKGDTLALLDTTDLVLQRDRARAALEALRAERAVLRTQVRLAKSNLGYAQERYERVKRLFEQQAAPQQRLDDAKNQLATVEAAYRSTQQRLRQLDAREKELGAQLKLIDKKLADAWIIAPAAGVVATRYFEEGEAVPPMQPVAELIYLREMEMKIYLPEEMLSQVKVGQPVKVKVDGREEPFPAKIVWISPRAEFTPKTIMTPETRVTLVYAAKLRLANPEGVLKHGMPAEAWLE